MLQIKILCSKNYAAVKTWKLNHLLGCPESADFLLGAQKKT